jgi:hypothetical protein
MSKRLERDAKTSKSMTRQFGRDISNVIANSSMSRQSNGGVNLSKDLSQKHKDSHSFSRHETQSTKVRRASSSIRSNKSSKNHLQEIGVDSKQQMFRSRCERQIFSKLEKVDRQTRTDVYHVSEFAADIQKHMQETQQAWTADKDYMSR